MISWHPRRKLPILRQTIVRKKSVRTQTVRFGRKCLDPTETAIIDQPNRPPALEAFGFFRS